MIAEAFIAITTGYLPPREYDHPYYGKLDVQIVTASRARELCPRFGVACVVEQSPSLCIIVVNGEYARWLARIVRHEVGHCNGWPSTHPDTR